MRFGCSCTHISRRSLLAGAGAAVGLAAISVSSNSANAASPGPSPKLKIGGVAVAGCCLSSETGSAALAKAVMDPVSNPSPQSTGNPALDYSLGTVLHEMADLFAVRPGLMFWDGPDSNNAFAMPKALLPGTKGTVLLGRALFSTPVAQSPDGSMSILAVCAHEFGHIVQYARDVHPRLLKGEATKRRVELHADFLAGYYLGRRSFDYSAGQRAHIVDAFAALGDTNMNDPEHHGTPEERIGALDTGFRMGRASGRGVDDAVDAGFYYLGA